MARLRKVEGGQLNVGLVSTAKYFVPRLLARFCEEHPGVEVRLVDDADWRETCRATAKAAPIAEKFYEGDERLFCDAIHELTFGAGAGK